MTAGMTLAEIAADPGPHWLSFAPGLYSPEEEPAETPSEEDTGDA